MKYIVFIVKMVLFYMVSVLFLVLAGETEAVTEHGLYLFIGLASIYYAVKFIKNTIKSLIQ